MKALIVGAGGQVGRALLASAPAAILAIGLPHEALDVGNESAVRDRVHGEHPDIVINAAAYTAVDRAESEPQAAWRLNAEAPGHLARAAQAAGSRLLHISTDFVFDGCASVPYPVNAATRPLSAYGRSKLAGEAAVLAALPDRSVIMRTAWVYAPCGSNFLLTMLRLMSSRGDVRVVADQIGTPTAAVSVAQALWAMTLHPELHGIHHWRDAGTASWYDFAVAIAEEAVPFGLLPGNVTVRPIATADYPTAARRPAYSVLDVGTLPAVLGVEPVHWRVRLRSVLREIANA
jgi:dTDP-4-dehydrorhamnose reductase